MQDIFQFLISKPSFLKLLLCSMGFCLLDNLVYCGALARSGQLGLSCYESPQLVVQVQGLIRYCCAKYNRGRSSKVLRYSGHTWQYLADAWVGTSSILIPPPPSVECQHPKAAVGGGTGNERRRNRQWISRILDGRGRWCTFATAVVTRGEY